MIAVLAELDASERATAPVPVRDVAPTVLVAPFTGEVCIVPGAVFVLVPGVGGERTVGTLSGGAHGAGVVVTLNGCEASVLPTVERRPLRRAWLWLALAWAMVIGGLHGAAR